MPGLGELDPTAAAFFVAQLVQEAAHAGLVGQLAYLGSSLWECYPVVAVANSHRAGPVGTALVFPVQRPVGLDCVGVMIQGLAVEPEHFDRKVAASQEQAVD